MRVLLSVTGAVILVVACVVDVVAPKTPPGREALCSAYSGLTESLDVASVSSQVAVRARASSLADLSLRYPVRTGSQPVAWTGQQVQSVLGSRYATARDLFVALRPVAVECGDAGAFYRSPTLIQRLEPSSPPG